MALDPNGCWYGLSEGASPICGLCETRPRAHSVLSPQSNQQAGDEEAWILGSREAASLVETSQAL